MRIFYWKSSTGKDQGRRRKGGPVTDTLSDLQLDMLTSLCYFFILEAKLHNNSMLHTVASKTIGAKCNSIFFLFPNHINLSWHDLQIYNKCMCKFFFNLCGLVVLRWWCLPLTLQLQKYDSHHVGFIFSHSLLYWFQKIMGKQHQHLNADLSAVNTPSTKRIELALTAQKGRAGGATREGSHS